MVNLDFFVVSEIRMVGPVPFLQHSEASDLCYSKVKGAHHLHCLLVRN